MQEIKLKKIIFCLLETLDIISPQSTKKVVQSIYIFNELLNTLKIENKNELTINALYLSIINSKSGSNSLRKKLLNHKIKGFEYLSDDSNRIEQEQLIQLINIADNVQAYFKKTGKIDKGITKPYLFKPKIKQALTHLVNNTNLVQQLNHSLLEQEIYEILPSTNIYYGLNDYENFALFLNIWANESHTELLEQSLALSFVVFTLGKCFNLPVETCHRIKTAALFHSLGKIGITTDILNKHPNLTAEEEVEFHSYPYYTFKIIKHLENIKDIILWATYNHHRLTEIDQEKKALLEIEIQLLAVSELYVSYRHDSEFKKGLPLEKAISKLDEVVEKYFNPTITKYLKKNLGLIEKNRKAGQELAKHILDPQFSIEQLQTA